MNRKTRIVTLALAAGIATTGLFAPAGDLNPPAGPIAPTMKTLAEVEPRIAVNLANTPGDADSLYKITQPGSYYLTGNVAGVSGKMGIEIAASGVSLDLMGFALAGVAGSLDGIKATVADTRSVAVRNGIVRDWGDYGLDLSNSRNNLVAGLRTQTNGFAGIFAGPASTINDCTSYLNAGAGIHLNQAGNVSGCTVYENGGDGIFSLFACNVTDCMAYSNGSDGIVAGPGSTMTACTAHDNADVGIFAQSGSTLTGCNASSNMSNGIQGNDGVTISGCTARLNGGRGFSLNVDPVLSDCNAYDNMGDGIRVIAGGSVRGCNASVNDGDGISAGPTTPAVVGGTTISECHASFNRGDGIQVFLACSVTGNTCDQNGQGAGAGIRVDNFGNLIDGNRVSNSNTGILVLTATNTIIRNSSRNNSTAYSIVAGNIVGTIVADDAAMNAATNSLINLRF